MEESNCVECSAVIFEPRGGPRSPCPVCGSLARRFNEKLEDHLTVHDGYRLKGYRAGSKKFFIDERSGPSYYRVGSEWHHLTRTIDRENNRYVETIRVLRTGELLKHEEGLLSQHVGHGG